jgi:hypothetical protein
MADNNVNRFSKEDAANANNMAQAARSLTEELKDQLGIRSRLNETQRETLNLARQLQRSAQENTVEIGNAGNIERQLVKDRKTRLAIERELIDLTEGINKASQTSLDNADRITKLTKEISRLEEIRVGRTGAIANRINNAIARKESELNSTQLIRDVDAQRIALLNQMSSVNDEVIEQRQVESQIQKDINDKMGVTGALVKGTGALMERLGMRSGIFQDAMKESAEAMREMAEETVRGNAEHSRTAIALKGASIVARGFGKALTDPAVIASGMLNTFLKINKTQAETSRLIGQSAATFKNTLNTEVASLNDVMVQINESTKELGLNAQAIFSPKTLASMAEAVNMLGLSSKQATNLGVRADYNNLTADQFSNSILRGADNMNTLANSAVAPGVVLNDVLNTSDDIALSLGNNPEALGQAATAARALGMELSRVDGIAEGLLDFESSIGYELEAQLLTGKQINLNKARELALNNDLAGLSQELAKNGASAAEFANMNRIQQNALAKSLGMSREELAKSIILQDKTNSLTQEQRAQVLGMEVSDLKRMDIQAKINKIVEKLLSIASPILDTFVAIVDNSFVLYGLLTTLAISKVPALVSGITSFAKSIKGGVIALYNLVAGRTADAAAATAQTAANTANTASVAAQTAARQTLFTTMTRGLAVMGTALGQFGVAAAPAVPILLSIAAVVAAIGIAAAGLGYGFKMAAEGFVNIMNNASMDKLKPLFLLGPALYGIAAGLGAIAFAGIAAIPALAALSGFALAATPLIAISGLFGGEGGDEDGFARLESKLDTLITVISEGGDVYLDSDKVGSTQAKSFSKLSLG